MDELLTLEYPKPYLGNYIDRWFVVLSDARRVRHFKTEAGALRLYNALTSHASLFRETDCKNADMLILSK